MQETETVSTRAGCAARFICAAKGHGGSGAGKGVHAGGIARRLRVMKKRLHKGFTLVELLVIIVAVGLLSFFFYLFFGPGVYVDDYPISARVSELVLAGSSAKTALSEGFMQQHSWSATWMSSITISATGMISSATIGPTGQIIVYGTATASSAIITLTPTQTDDFKLVWTCVGRPAKYMPASCRPYK